MLSYFKFFISLFYLSILCPNNLKEIDLFNFNDIYYISASDFCEINNYDYVIYTEKGKFKIKFPQDQVIFSTNSSFVSLNQKTYHMINKVQFKNDTFYIPVNSFLHFCNKLNLQSISANFNNKKALISNPFNISNYTIDDQGDVVLLNIFSNINFNINAPTLNLLDSNQLEIFINNGIVNSSKIIEQQLDESVLVTQNNNGVVFLFNSKNSLLNYSYEIKSDRLIITINKLLKTQYIYNPSDWEINTIIIDPGHGGKDPGAIGYHHIKEKHIVLDVAQELGALINKNMPNMKVIYTREDDTFLGLKNRTSIANKNKGHIFISIHANSSSAKSARGYEIFLLQPNSVSDAIDVAIRENASIKFEKDKNQYNENQIIATLAQNSFLKESEKLATFIQVALKKELPKTRNRGIKQAGFHVLVGASMPNLLIEVGFLTNKSEAQLLNKSYYRAQLAKAIFEGVQEYVESYNY